MGTELGLLDYFLHDPINGSDFILDGDPDLGSTRARDSSRLDDVEPKMDLLSTSLHENGLLANSEVHGQEWGNFDTETDALLDSILTGNDTGFNPGIGDNVVIDENDGHALSSEDVIGGGRLSFEGAMSDDGSVDSGIEPQQITSPHSLSQVSSPEHELQDILAGGGIDSDDHIRVQVVTPATLARSTAAKTSTVTRYVTGFKSGTTILLPVLTSKSSISSTAVKRRRVSDSSSDSGNSSCDPRSGEDSRSPKIIKTSTSTSKYPPLILTEEEKRICERENIKLPSHYPLTKEEEKNLKRIRRKIRNKVSAQDSRRRKKEYMDNMEERVKQCSTEKEELQKRIEQLETQNKTLAGQLRRLHQIIVNGGLKQTQTSTAMMVLLLSTALFLLPGFREQHEGQKPEPSSQLDISRAIKMPPMPGQSRSLLQFNQIKQEFDEPAGSEVETPMATTGKVVLMNNTPVIKKEGAEASTLSFSATADHDYVGGKFESDSGMKKKKSYIVEDVPPEGYGFTDPTQDEIKMEVDDQEEVYFVTEEEVVISDKYDSDFFSNEERKLNVSVATSEGSGLRTIVLHVPKDIK